jgi:hypothetical protein
MFDFEDISEPLLPVHKFVGRLLANFAVAFLMIVASLVIGILGYQYFEHMNAIDAFLNASMILSGMGPMGAMHSDGGKIFAGCYALFAGIVVLAASAILLAPVAHRIFHAFHLADDDDG